MVDVAHWQSVIEFLKAEIETTPKLKSTALMNLRIQLSSAELNLKHLSNKKAQS